MRGLSVLGCLLLSSGCVRAIDGYLVKHPIAQTLTMADPNLACLSANANVAMAASVGNKKKPWRALTILELTAAGCSEEWVMAAELDAERAWVSLQGDARIREVKDARERERRARALTALRLERAFKTLEAAVGPVGEACPKLKSEEDQQAYLLGLIAGAAALLHDQSSGGAQGITSDRVVKVARGAACLDDDRWWHVPAALRAGAWAMVPGSGPEGVDGWEALAEAANRGDAAGMRLARATQIQLAANAGRVDDVKAGLKAFAAVTRAPAERYLMLDVQAAMIARHQSDLLWVRALGYRSPSLGALPDDPVHESGSDPFMGDPFAEDPFAEDPTGAAPDKENP